MKAALLLLLPGVVVHGFLNPKRTSPEPSTLPPKPTSHNVLQSLADFATTIGTVLTGMGTGVAMLTALEPKLRKKQETVDWRKAASSFTLIASGEQLKLDPEMASPLWVAAGVAVFYAQQQQAPISSSSTQEEDDELELRLRNTVQELRNKQQNENGEKEDSNEDSNSPQLQVAHDQTDTGNDTDGSSKSTTKTIRIKPGSWNTKLEDPMNDPVGIGTFQEIPISIRGTAEELIMTQLARETMELKRQTETVVSQLAATQRMGKTYLEATTNGSQYAEYPHSAWRDATATTTDESSKQWREQSTPYDHWVSSGFGNVTPDSIDVSIAKASGYVQRLNRAVNGLSELDDPEVLLQPEKMTTMPRKLVKGDYSPTKANVKQKKGTSSPSYLEEMKTAASILTSFVDAVAQDVAPSNVINGEQQQQQQQQQQERINGMDVTTAPDDKEETVKAPKMTTIPAKSNFAPGSFAPTKPDVKNISGRATFYLEELQTSLQGLSTFVEQVETAAPKMTTIPKAQIFVPSQYAPTKPSVKSIDGQTPTYLDELKYVLSGLNSFGNVVVESEETQPSDVVAPPGTKESSIDSQQKAPKMTTIPSSKTKSSFQPGSFAPTKPQVKDKSGQSPTYLQQLNALVSGLSFSFDAPVATSREELAMMDAIEAPKMVTVPAKNTYFQKGAFAPTKPHVKDVSGLTPTYLEQLKESIHGLISFADAAMSHDTKVVDEQVSEAATHAPKMTTMPPPNRVFQHGAFAPTKPSVKQMSGRSPTYLEALQSVVSELSSFVDNVSSENSASNTLASSSSQDADVIKAPKMTTVPGKNQKFQFGSFAPTKPQVKDMSGLAPTYLDQLKNVVNGLSSFLDAVTENEGYSVTNSEDEQPAPKMTTVPRKTKRSFEFNSFAPTKPSVRNVSSKGVEYLDQLKLAVGLSSFASTSTATMATDKEEEDDPIEVTKAPKMTTMPAKATQFEFNRFAPTKQSVKQVSSRGMEYLDQLKLAVGSLTSFVPTKEGSSSKDQVQNSSTLMPSSTAAPTQADPTPPVGSYLEALTSIATMLTDVGSVEELADLLQSPAPSNLVADIKHASKHPPQINGYIEALNEAASVLSSFVSEVSNTLSHEDEQTPKVEKMTTVPGKDNKFKGKSFAPTKPTVKGISSRSVAQASGYLETLKDAINGLSMNPAAFAAAPKMTTVPMRKPSAYPKGMFSPTKPSVKNVSSASVSQAGNYLDALKSVADTLASASSIEELTEILQTPAPKMSTVPGPRPVDQRSDFSPTKSGVKCCSTGPLPPIDSYLKSLGDAATGLSSFVSAVNDSMAEDDALPAPEKMTTVPGKENKFKGKSFAPTKPSVKGISSRSVAQASDYLETLKEAIAALSSNAAMDDDTSMAPKMTTVPMRGSVSFRSGSFAPTKPSVRDMSSTSVSQAGTYLDALRGVAATLAGVSSVEELSELLQAPAPKMMTVPGPGSPFRGADFSATKSSVKDKPVRAPIDSYIEALGNAASGLTSFVSTVANTFEDDEPSEKTQPVAEKMTTVPGKESKFRGQSFAPTKPSVKGISSHSVSQAAGYLDTLKDAIAALSVASHGNEDLAPKMTTVPMRGSASFGKDAFAPTKSSVKDVSSRPVSHASSYLDALRGVANVLASASSAKELSELLQAPAPKMVTVPGPSSPFRGMDFSTTKSSVKNISSSSVSQASNYLSALKDVSTTLASANSCEELSDLLRSPAPKMTTVPGRESPFRGSNFATTKPSVKLSDGGSTSSYSDDYLKKLSKASNALASFVDIAAVEVNKLARGIETPVFQTMPQPSRNLASRSYAPTKPSVKDVVLGIPTLPSYLSEIQNTVSSLSSFVDVTPLIEASKDDQVQSAFTSVPRKGLAFKPGGYFPRKPAAVDETTGSVNTHLSSLKDSPHLNSFVDSKLTTSKHIHVEHLPYPQHYMEQNGHEFPIAAAQSVPSFETVQDLISELEEYKDSTTAKLSMSQEKIDATATALSSSVDTLSETVVNLSSCVQELNRAVKSLAAFAEALNVGVKADPQLLVKRP